VIFLVLPGVNMLDLAGPMQVFHVAATLGAGYTLRFWSLEPNVVSAQGMPIGPLEPLGPVDSTDLVVIAGLNLQPYASGAMTLHPAIPIWLDAAYRQGAHLAAVCTGAFVLGEIGLLDGRRCTTHWSSVDQLQLRYPAAKVLDDVLYMHDGRITTSAGIATGIDMALSLVEQAYGPALTAQVARALVVYLRRDSAHSQSSVYLQYRSHLHPGVHRAQDYLIAHMAEALTLDEIAAAAQMSVRSLARNFRVAIGLSPIEYQHQLRLELAATLLHNPDLTIEDVAQKIGFADSRHFRRLWSRRFGAPPSAYREKKGSE
jgi:transcriptional regulator GlxA family with amidase domain